MSFAGCRPTSAADGLVTCECAHLTEFSAAEDVMRPACGDGVIVDRELCDDANLVMPMPPASQTLCHTPPSNASNPSNRACRPGVE